MPLRHPTPLLEARLEHRELVPICTTMCAGFEMTVWRAEQLAKHLIKWLPEFALRHSERAAMDHANGVEMIARAAKSVYESPRYQNRGEFGEILLHAILRQQRKTIPAISKYFFKDSSNDTVKGFDAVHVVQDKDDLELWLGEVKFYDDCRRATRDVMEEIEKHLRRDYLRGEFTAITNKLDGSWDCASRLETLLHENTTLDRVFASVCVPVLLTYDSEVVDSHSRVCKEYVAALEAEVLAHHRYFAEQYQMLVNEARIPTVRVELFLLPVKEKRALVALMHQALMNAQALG